MPVLGVVVEYNPFHNGHFYHLEASKSQTGLKDVLAVMSGNYVQRGEPAICDKWRRTRMALLHGVDIVIELPVYYATASAEYFAKAAVQLLNAAGMVECLCFGSESGDIEKLQEVGGLLSEETPAFKEALRSFIRQGLPYPTARAEALNTGLQSNDLLREPNNILGVEYCKALAKTASAIRPATIARNRQDDSFIPAKFLRSATFCGDYEKIRSFMPTWSCDIFMDAIAQKQAPLLLDRFSDLFQYILRTSTIESLKNFQDMPPDMVRRFLHYGAKYRLISDILQNVKTKAFTYTRLQRSLLHTVLGLTEKDFAAYEESGGPPYIRVLGFRKDKAYLLRELQAKASLPVLTNLKYAKNSLSPLGIRMLEKEIETTGLYALAGDSLNWSRYHEYTQPLVIV